MEAGGLSSFDANGKRPTYAQGYAEHLPKLGFREISVTPDYKPMIGDMVVFQSFEGKSGPNGYRGSKAGHIQMWNGQIWVSDFRQSNDFWPGKGYREASPSYSVFR